MTLFPNYKQTLFVIVMCSGTLLRLSSIATTISIEKDWAVILSNQDPVLRTSKPNLLNL